jgi:hypothetical protein
LRLLGYAAEAGATLSAAAPGELPLTLAWRADEPLDANLLVSVQLVGPGGNVAWRGPGRVPVAGLYPTNAWRPGEVVTDYYALPIGPDLVPGAYRLQVGLFPPFAVHDEGWTDVTTIMIGPPTEQAMPPNALRARFDEQWLLGYDLPDTAAPGASVEVTLYWLRSESPSQTVTALGESRSLDAWQPHTVTPQVYTVRAPTEADSFDLEVTVETGAPARCGWLAPVQTGCPLPPVRLAGPVAAAGARNFDHQLLLNSATLETPDAVPGGQVRVTLEWQGLRRMRDGQVDAWPVSGTQATSTWEPGQPLRDDYAIAVPADAPPGPYQVEIGLYLLATGERLPVLNEAGDPIDDRVLLDGLTIGAP